MPNSAWAPMHSVVAFRQSMSTTPMIGMATSILGDLRDTSGDGLTGIPRRVAFRLGIDPHLDRRPAIDRPPVGQDRLDYFPVDQEPPRAPCRGGAQDVGTFAVNESALLIPIERHSFLLHIYTIVILFKKRNVA